MGNKNQSIGITLKAPKLGGMSDHLIRQRRNLIITSLIVVFILYTGVQISKVAIFGIEIQTPKQQALMNTLWAIWAYFFIRYYQYLRIESGTGFWGICVYKAKINIAIMVGKQINNETEHGPRTERGIILHNMEKMSLFEWDYLIKDYNPETGTEEEVGRVHFKSYQFVLPIAKGIINTIINTAKFTDNVLPILIAFLTALYGLIKAQT